MIEIAILGAGITGMVTALALAKKNIKTTIIEKNNISIDTPKLNFFHDVRTTTFTQASKEFLEEIGIWESLENVAGFINEIYILDNKSPSILHLSNDIGKTRGYVIPNMILKEKLFHLISNNNLIELIQNIKYDLPSMEEDHIVISKEQNIIAKNLLVCDGRNTSLHKLFEVYIDKSYNQTALVSVIKHEQKHEGTAVEHFMPQGPFAALPMKNQYHSSIVWTEPTEVANLYSKMPIKKLELHLQERMGDYLGKVKIISELQIFPLTAKITKNYYKGNIALIGDAAHSIHPLAGQGLNQGIKDIKSITSIIEERFIHGLNIDILALKEYENSRKLDNYLMYLITDKLNHLFKSQNPIFSSWRKLGLRIQNESQFLKNFVSNYGSGYSKIV